ncbi:MAG: NUDIX hydrolase [bacterium]
MSKAIFNLEILPDTSSAPADKNVSAVFLIAFNDDGILCGRNERGWDIPGGHLDEGESSLTALIREIREEGGSTFINAIPYAVLTSSSHEKVMLFFAANNFSLVEFTPSEDTFERKIFGADEFLKLYYGDKSLMAKLIEEAKKAVGK